MASRLACCTGHLIGRCDTPIAIQTMNQETSPVSQAVGLSLGNLRWPHLQRLAERWLRQWGYALSGLTLGLCGVALTHPEVSEEHAHVAQAVARLQQQLAAVPRVEAQPETPLTPDAQRLLARLPVQAQQGRLWADWSRLLAAHALRLQSLQPMPVTAADGRNGGLSSQAVALRWQGRFEDWSNVWAACALTGPVCSLDRISVVAMADSSEVQIDAVLRVWMRPDEVGADEWPGLAAWIDPGGVDQRPISRSSAALFAQAGAVSWGRDAARVAQTTDPTAAAAAATSDLSAAAEALPEDPRQWPLARVRLVGLWQQGADRQAILSVGAHWAKVSLGQRVTLEGHKVAAITDDGVRLRLAQGPLFQLDWAGEMAGSPKRERSLR